MSVLFDGGGSTVLFCHGNTSSTLFPLLLLPPCRVVLEVDSMCVAHARRVRRGFRGHDTYYVLFFSVHMKIFGLGTLSRRLPE